MTPRRTTVSRLLSAALILAAAGVAARARGWDRKFVGSLPDSAFAFVETGIDGKPRRHLPHHDLTGRVDLAHLRSALRRWRHVRWQNPAYARTAFEHLRWHQLELCREGSMLCPREEP